MSYGDFRKCAQYLDFPISEGELCELMFRFKYILRPNTVNYSKFLNALFVFNSNEKYIDERVCNQLCIRSDEEVPISKIISHFSGYKDDESKISEVYNIKLSEMKEGENNVNEEYDPIPFKGEILINPNNINGLNESKMNENERKEEEEGKREERFGEKRRMEESKMDKKRTEEICESKSNKDESKSNREEENESKSDREFKRKYNIEEFKNNKEKEESKSNKEESKSNKEQSESKSNKDDYKRPFHVEESKKSESKTN